MLYHFLNFFGLVNKVFAEPTNFPGELPPAPSSISPVITNPLDSDSILQLIQKLLDTVVQIGIPVIALAIVYAGFLFVKAQGNESKLTEAKQILLYTVIGAGIVLGATVISRVIQTTIDSL